MERNRPVDRVTEEQDHRDAASLSSPRPGGTRRSPLYHFFTPPCARTSLSGTDSPCRRLPPRFRPPSPGLKRNDRDRPECRPPFRSGKGYPERHREKKQATRPDSGKRNASRKNDSPSRKCRRSRRFDHPSQGRSAGARQGLPQQQNILFLLLSFIALTRENP
jgi:hypothetical protein